MFKAKMDPTLCRIMDIYRLVGIWRNEEESGFRSYYMRMLYFLQYFSFVIYVAKGLCEAYQTDDVFFLFYIQIGITVVLVKLAYLLWRKDEILKFLYNPIVTHCTEDYRESLIVDQKLKPATTFNKWYYLVLTTNSIIAIAQTLPIFTNDEKMLPFFIRYTYNTESDYDVVLYWMTYVYASVSVALSSIYCFTMLFIWYILYNYAIEYKLLGDRFRSMGTKTTDTYLNELIHLIRAHNNLFDSVEQFRSFFSTIFLLEIILGGISICVSTYTLSFNTPKNVFFVVFNVGILLYAIFEIFLIMYLANEITIKSNRLSYCLFESNWTDQSEVTKKHVIILCELIKRPHQLVVFIYPMNLEKFTSIVNGAYSLFNILKSFK